MSDTKEKTVRQQQKLWMKPDVRDKLAEIAEAEGQSMSASVTHMVEDRWSAYMSKRG